MRIYFRVEQVCRNKRYGGSEDMPGYYGTNLVVQDLERVLESHRTAYENYKSEFISTRGQEAWDIEIASEKEHYSNMDKILDSKLGPKLVDQLAALDDNNED